MQVEKSVDVTWLLSVPASPAALLERTTPQWLMAAAAPRSWPLQNLFFLPLLCILPPLLFFLRLARLRAAGCQHGRHPERFIFVKSFSKAKQLGNTRISILQHVCHLWWKKRARSFNQQSGNQTFFFFFALLGITNEPLVSGRYSGCVIRRAFVWLI